MLKYFAQYPIIDSVNFVPTYAGRVNQLGLVEKSALSAKKCTAPLYGGYSNVKILDFTNVHITDDELRFLIKMPKLQAVGLSGTKITNKGLKYLSQHATFQDTLQCLKLCYVENINGQGLTFLCDTFKNIKEFDLWGCNQLSLLDLKSLLNLRMMKVRVPEDIHTLITDRHNFYSALSRKHTDLVLNVKEIQELEDMELVRQLKYHRKHFKDIYVNVARDELLHKLENILTEINIQENLFAIIM